MVPGLVSFVVQVAVFFLQVELDPVVKTNDFCSRFCLSNKHMLESTGVQPGECFSLEIPHKTLLQNNSITFYTFVVNHLIASCTHTDLMMNLTMIICWCLDVSSISPRVSLSVVEVEPNQAQLILKDPQVRVGLSFAHQVLMSPLWRNHIYDVHINVNPTGAIR